MFRDKFRDNCEGNQLTRERRAECEKSTFISLGSVAHVAANSAHADWRHWLYNMLSILSMIVIIFDDKDIYASSEWRIYRGGWGDFSPGPKGPGALRGLPVK